MATKLVKENSSGFYSTMRESIVTKSYNWTAVYTEIIDGVAREHPLGFHFDTEIEVISYLASTGYTVVDNSTTRCDRYELVFSHKQDHSEEISDVFSGEFDTFYMNVGSVFYKRVWETTVTVTITTNENIELRFREIAQRLAQKYGQDMVRVAVIPCRVFEHSYQ